MPKVVETAFSSQVRPDLPSDMASPYSVGSRLRSFPKGLTTLSSKRLEYSDRHYPKLTIFATHSMRICISMKSHFV